MKIIYFSKNYTPHDHRFLSSLSTTEHEIFYLKLEANQRQMEDRPVPSNVQQILWAGGQREFRWTDLPRLTFAFRRLTKEIKPDLIHAGPIQTCAFIAARSGFRPILTMCWGYDLAQDADKNACPIEQAIANIKTVSPDSQIVRTARDVGVSFGAPNEDDYHKHDVC